MHSDGHSTWSVCVCVCVRLLHFLPPHNNVSNATQNEQDFKKGVFFKKFCYLPTGLSWPFYYSMHIPAQYSHVVCLWASNSCIADLFGMEIYMHLGRYVHSVTQ